MRFSHRVDGSSRHRSGAWSRVLRTTAGVGIAVTLTMGMIAAVEEVTVTTASADVIGPGSIVSEPGFAGMVTSGGRQLGTARLANGARGVCLDAGGRPWPSGVATVQHVRSPRAAYVLATWGGTRDAVRAAAVAAVVAIDLGQNSNAGYLRSTVAQLHRQYPAAADQMESLRSQMLAEATRYAGAYSTTALTVVPRGTTGKGGVGTVDGIGASSSSGSYVPGRTITLTLNGARWSRNDKATITVSSSTSAQSLSWYHASPGTVKVTESIAGLPATFYKRQPAINGSQRVGLSAGSLVVTGTAAAEDVSKVQIHKIDARSGRSLAGASFRVWNDLNDDGAVQAGEPSATATSGPAGNLPVFAAFASSRVCAKETSAPAGYVVRAKAVCRIAGRSGTTADPVVIRIKNYPTPVEELYPLTITKTTDASDPGDPAGIVGVKVEVRQGSAVGPVVPGGTYTFAASDVANGVGTHSWSAVLHEDVDYFVVIVSEPAGYEPARTVVQAELRTNGAGEPVRFAADLLDYKIWNPGLSTQINDQSAALGSQIVDHVTVTQTGGHTVIGEWTLYGPIPPSEHGTCEDLDWSVAPVAGAGQFTAVGDGTYTVGGYTVDEAGCFTYSESLGGSEHTTPHAPTTPGIPSETTLVKGQPRLQTSVSKQRATAGATLIDHVEVTGTGGAHAIGLWRVLGPLAANAKGTCTGLDWAEAPARATGEFSVHGDGTYLVGKVVVRDAGCYTYQERTRSSSTATASGWTTPGVRTETSLVRPTRPHVPGHPFVSTGFDGILPGYGSQRRGPVGTVTTTGVRATLLPIEFRGSTLDPSDARGVAGIWGSGAPLSAVAGTTVLVGHVSDEHDSPLAFHGLGTARIGQVITTRSGATTTRWRIASIRQSPRDALDRSIFAQRIHRRLVLVTCAHRVVTPGGHFHYTDNRVVRAVPVR